MWSAINESINNAAQALAQCMSKAIDPIIIVVGIVVLVLMITRIGQFKNIDRELFKALNPTGESTLDDEEHDRIIREQGKLPKIDKMREYEEKYNKVSKWYILCQLMIPVFPLLGILGTIDGLIINLTADQSQMLNSLSVALYSTFLGLIFSIILRIIDSVIIAPIIQSIEGQLDTYDSLFDKLNLQRTADSIREYQNDMKIKKHSAGE